MVALNILKKGTIADHLAVSGSVPNMDDELV